MFSEKQSALKNWNSHFLKLDTNEDGVVSLKELTRQFLCGAPPSPDTYQLSCINQANVGVGSMAAETAARDLLKQLDANQVSEKILSSSFVC